MELADWGDAPGRRLMHVVTVPETPRPPAANICLAMLRRVRQKLRLIRYYSAPRAHSNWTRAMDIALIASFFLAFPAAWMCDLLIVRKNIAITVGGQLFTQADGAIAALVLNPPKLGTGNVKGDIAGTFALSVEDWQHGWPLTTTVRRQPARLDIDLRREPQPRINAQLAADDPIRRAIAAELEKADLHEALAAWRTPEFTVAPNAAVGASAPNSAREPVQVRHQWTSMVMAWGVWWLIFIFASFTTIQSLRLGALIVRARGLTRKAQLRAEGKCLACGYDMTGLEFNERCPECGELVW